MNDWTTKAVIGIIILAFITGGLKICGSSTTYRRYSYSTPSRITPYPTKNPTTTPKTTYGGNYSGSSGSREKSSDKSSDPYHASDYYDYEDFYYDHWDDFFDIDDAEDYWIKNH